MKPCVFWEFLAPLDAVHLSAFIYDIMEQGPQGDGHTVIVLPGFCAGQYSTSVLRSVLILAGYDAIDWGQGVNLGPNQEMDIGLAELIQEKEGTVTLIGWSLGGLMARVLANRYPDKIRRVITLGSPHKADIGESSLLPLFQLLSPRRVSDFTEEELAQVRNDPPVPLTSIYTQFDGLVRWQDCLCESENIEIYGSHLGMTHNPDVLRLILERLDQR